MPRIKSSETQHFREPAVDHAVGGHIVFAFVGANCSSRFRTQDPIDGAVIVPSARKSALYFHNRVSAVISVILGIVVIVRVVVPIIGIRIEDWKTKRVEEDERSIVETAEAIVTIIVAKTVEAIVTIVECAHCAAIERLPASRRHRTEIVAAATARSSCDY